MKSIGSGLLESIEEKRKIFFVAFFLQVQMSAVPTKFQLTE